MLKKLNCFFAFIFLMGIMNAGNVVEKNVVVDNVKKMPMTENENILAKTFLYTAWLSVPDIMSKPYSDLRNTLITQVKNRCKDSLSSLQALSDDDLAWSALMCKFLRDAGRDSVDLSNLTLDDYRNTVITLNNQNTDRSISTLQSYSNARNLNIAYQWWFEQNEFIQFKIDQLNSITASNAFFDMKDNQSTGMDVLRIVEADEASYKYLGVYHSQISSNHFVLRLAGSNDLKVWHYITNLGDRSHQGDIKKWGDGYLVANEQDPVEGSNNIRIRFFSSYANLITNNAANDMSVPHTFSSTAEGTPDIRTIVGDDPVTSHIVIGFHYYDNGVHDQNAIGILYHFTNWRAWKDVISNYNIQLMGYNGNIGGRSSFYSNGNYVLQEAQITSNDWSSWRFLFGDGAFYYTLNPVTPKGSTSFANPGIAPIGSDKFVVTAFMPTEGNQSGERGDLLYLVDFADDPASLDKPVINSTNNDVKVYSKEGLIHIANAENSQITIYDITGGVRTRVAAKSSLESFNLKGVFVISVVSEQSRKNYKVINL
ncbi:MAG: hypothetical protein PHH37_12625 [Paludibacter sp.]|nr:hypothetical protein [Paludibacter sp.]